MPVADRTYSFRATADLAPRMRAVGHDFRVIAEAGLDTGSTEQLANELAIAIVREGIRLPDAEENQSAFMRDAIELVLAAAEKLARDRHWAGQYAAAGRSPEEVAFARGARMAAARRWRSG